MDKLLELLEQLYNQTIEESAYYYEDEMSWYFKDENVLAQEVTWLCDELLIDKGQCNWENIAKLRDAGYRVYAGERDSFGWLTGCVQKKDDKRIIVYG